METAVQVKSKPREKPEVEAEVKIEIKSETKNETATPPAAKRRRPPAKRRNLAEERIRKEKEASGASKEKEASGASKVKGDKREEAIAAFRAKYGELNGATVCHMPGWRAESLWGEACQKRAVNYFNERGNCFTTVKDIEGDTPAEPGNRWRLVELEEEIKKDRVPSAAGGRRSTFDNTSLMPKIKRRITGKTAPPESAGGTARASNEPPPPHQFISVINGTATSHDPMGMKSKIRIAERSSGVRHIAWNKRPLGWQVEHRVPGKGRKSYRFPTKKWVAEGLAFEEAVAKALEEAKAFLAELRARGAVREAGPGARSSGVRGVQWWRARSLWTVQLGARDAAGRTFHVEKPAHFRPADDSEAAIEEARLKAVRCRQDMEARHQVFVRGGEPIPQRK